MNEAHDTVVQPHVVAHTFTRALVHSVKMVPNLRKKININITFPLKSIYDMAQKIK